MSSLAALTGREQAPTTFREDIRFACAVPGEPEAISPAAEKDPLAIAWAEGFAQGQLLAQADRADADAADEAARERLGLNLRRIEAELAEDLRRRLIETVTRLCEATLEPYALDNDVLVRRVERAVAMLSRADDSRVIRLNPEDRRLIADSLASDWTVTDDPALPRGSLRVETETGGVEDGPDHWRRSLVEAFSAC